MIQTPHEVMIKRKAGGRRNTNQSHQNGNNCIYLKPITRVNYVHLHHELM